MLGKLIDIKFKNTERFNFGFDCVDAIADKYPEKLAMIHLDKNKNEKRFTFKNIKQESNRTANYNIFHNLRRRNRTVDD